MAKNSPFDDETFIEETWNDVPQDIPSSLKNALAQNKDYLYDTKNNSIKPPIYVYALIPFPGTQIKILLEKKPAWFYRKMISLCFGCAWENFKNEKMD